MILDYLRLAMQNLSRRRVRSWLTMIGIFIGIAAVVSLISLGSGLKQAITGQFSELGTDKIMIQASGTNYGPPGSTALKKLTEEDADAIDKIKGTDFVIKRLLRMVILEGNDKTSFNYAVSIPEDEEPKQIALDVLGAEIGEGRMLEKKDKNKVVLGYDFMAKKILGKKLAVGDKLKVNGHDCEVVGFLKRSGSVFGNDLVLMNHDVMKDIVDAGKEVDIIAVQISSTENIDKVSDDINKLLRDRRNVDQGDEDFSVSTPQDSIEALNSILSAVQWFLVGIAGISIIVGGVGIMNTMYTSVLERKKEIGIMKSIGAKNSNILSIFMIESGLLGMVGGLIGILLGVILAELVKIGGNAAMGPGFIETYYSYTLIFGSLTFSFGIGALSGILPAFQAAQLDPVNALRK